MNAKLAESLKIYETLFELNQKALAEKGPGRPPFWEMVFWWTRKPLIGARAAILGCLLPEDTDLRDFKRMIRLEDKSPHRSNPAVPPKYEGYVNGKKLLDPFAGFGSIPLESLRLGLEATAVELLPTAYVFLKAVLEYPKLKKELVEELVEGVKYWGNWVTEELRRDPTIRELYDPDVAVYVGSWEVKCPNCQRWTPLVGNWWLARVRSSKGYERLAFFRYDKDRNAVEVVDFGREDSKKAILDEGSVKVGEKVEKVPEPNVDAKRNTAKCLRCGAEIKRSVDSGEDWYVKWAIKKYNEGDERFAKPRLLAKVKVVNGDLLFEPCSDEDNAKLERAKEIVRQIWGDPDIPTEPIPEYEARSIWVIVYGFDKFYKLSNPRQLLTLVKLVKLIREAGKRVEEEKLGEGWSREEAFKYAEAVTTYLAIALCKYINYNTMMTWLHSSNPWGVDISPSLADRGIAMQWNWCDVNPFIEKGISGILKTPISFTNSLKKSQIRALTYLVSAVSGSPKVRVLLDDATVLSKLDDEKFDLIVTDPPYRDDVPYAELSDFYYVWLKRALSDSDGKRLTPRFHAEAFFRKVGAKHVEIPTQWQEFAKREISYSIGRHGDKNLALQSYKDLFTEALKSMKGRLKEDGIIAIYFAHSSFEAWAELLEALMSAGLRITNAFPLATESKDRVTSKKKLTMDTSLLITCRPSRGGEVLLSNLRPQIEDNARKVATSLAAKDVPGRDVLIATMVSAIKPITEHSRVVTPAGPVSIIEILEKDVYPVVGRALAEAYGAKVGEKVELRDSHTLFYLLAKICFGAEGGTKVFTRDDVVTLCRASLLTLNEARSLVAEAKANEDEFEEGSSVASSKAVKLLEITDTAPEKIRQFLSKKKLPITEPSPKNAVEAYHYLLYFASQYPAGRVKEEFREFQERFPFAEEAYRLAKIVSRMKNGAETLLSRKLVQAVEGVEG